MRPDIDAGPIGRKCSVSNGPAGVALPVAAAGRCSERTTSDCAAKAPASMRASAMKRTCFMAGLRGCVSGRTLLQKLADLRVDEVVVGGVAAAAGGMTPQRRDRRELDAADELALVARVAERKVQIRLARHVEQRNLNGAQRLLVIAVEAGRVADVVPLPGARLRDQVVRVAHGVAAGPLLDHRVDALPSRLEQLASPPFLREHPAGPV